MDIISALAEGKRGAVARSGDVASYVIEEPEAIGLLIEVLSFHDTTVVSHAAHACLSVFMAHPSMLVPYKKQLIAILLQHDQWELLEQLSKIVPHLGCTDEEGVTLAIRMLAIIENGHSSIARTCALQALADLASINPIYEIYRRQAFGYALEKGTKAMQARVRKLMVPE